MKHVNETHVEKSMNSNLRISCIYMCKNIWVAKIGRGDFTCNQEPNSNKDEEAIDNLDWIIFSQPGQIWRQLVIAEVDCCDVQKSQSIDVTKK